VFAAFFQDYLINRVQNNFANVNVCSPLISLMHPSWKKSITFNGSVSWFPKKKKNMKQHNFFLIIIFL